MSHSFVQHKGTIWGALRVSTSCASRQQCSCLICRTLLRTLFYRTLQHVARPEYCSSCVVAAHFVCCCLRIPLWSTASTGRAGVRRGDARGRHPPRRRADHPDLPACAVRGRADRVPAALRAGVPGRDPGARAGAPQPAPLTLTLIPLTPLLVNRHRVPGRPACSKFRAELRLGLRMQRRCCCADQGYLDPGCLRRNVGRHPLGAAPVARESGVSKCPVGSETGCAAAGAGQHLFGVLAAEAQARCRAAAECNAMVTARGVAGAGRHPLLLHQKRGYFLPQTIWTQAKPDVGSGRRWAASTRC